MQGRRTFIQRLLALGVSAGSASLASSLSGCAQTGQARTASVNRTGAVLDPLFFEHDMAEHPENAQRLVAIDRELEKRGLWDKLVPVKARQASKEELRWAHSQAYIDEIASISEYGGGYFNPYLGDTYLNESSFTAAKQAAGAAIELNLAVYDRQIDNGFALLRPPGHHALESKAMGFCLFNSDVIAARALQQYRGVERVAIVDFDVHHGNGTQDLTIDDPSIMSISIHQHPFWPMTGGMEHIGQGRAAGTNINCPFGKGAGDEAYLNVYDQVIEPKLARFRPDQIIAFAGYDAHWQDHLAEHRVSIDGFNRLVSKLMATAEHLCGGRLALSLGGGYQLEPLAHSVAGSFEVLLGETPKADPIGASPRAEIDYSEHLARLKAHHLKAV